MRVGSDEHEVVLDSDGIRVDGAAVAARLLPIDDTPVQIVTIGDEVHRAIVRRAAARGQYSVWLDGYRFEVEALDERTRAIRALSGAAAS